MFDLPPCRAAAWLRRDAAASRRYACCRDVILLFRCCQPLPLLIFTPPAAATPRLYDMPPRCYSAAPRRYFHTPYAAVLMMPCCFFAAYHAFHDYHAYDYLHGECHNRSGLANRRGGKVATTPSVIWQVVATASALPADRNNTRITTRRRADFHHAQQLLIATPLIAAPPAPRCVRQNNGNHSE